jgi:hypothetical protein
MRSCCGRSVSLWGRSMRPMMPSTAACNAWRSGTRHVPRCTCSSAHCECRHAERCNCCKCLSELWGSVILQSLLMNRTAVRQGTFGRLRNRFQRHHCGAQRFQGVRARIFKFFANVTASRRGTSYGINSSWTGVRARAALLQHHRRALRAATPVRTCRRPSALQACLSRR